MSDVMSVRLHLSGVRVRGVLVDAVDRLEVAVEDSAADHRRYLAWAPANGCRGMVTSSPRIEDLLAMLVPSHGKAGGLEAGCDWGMIWSSPAVQEDLTMRFAAFTTVAADSS